MPPFDAAMAKRHKKGLSAKQVRQWVAVATSTYDACIKRGGSTETCEAQAIRAANGVTGMPKANHDAMHLVPATLSTHAASIRYEMFDGARHVVAPAVAIIAGVLNDYLVSADDIAEVLPSWQGIPVPINHPRNEWGEPISANSPEMLAHAVGRFFHPQLDGEKLRGEVWLNADKCTALGGEALEALQRIEAGEPLEISTAFYAKDLPLQGLHKGTHYVGQRTQLRPDHVALLPNSIGACSLAAGCGVHALQAHCTCQQGDDSMPIDAELKTPGKLRQALRTLFAFANQPEPPEEDMPEPPGPPSDPDEDEDNEPEPDEEDAPAPAAVTTHQQEKGTYTMLTKQELVGRLVAHEHSSWKEENVPGLLTLEERMLEQMLQELDRRQQEAPLTLKALQNELNTRDQALKAEYDTKLTTHLQALEEKQERAQLLAFFEARGWAAEETQALPLTALRRMHQELDPVSYLGNGLPRLSAQAYDDNLPTDNPATE